MPHALAGDVLNYSIGPDYWWVIIVKSIVILGFLATVGAYSTLAERKVSARIQLRLGPNRVGPFGMMQPAADGVKTIFKEVVMPVGRDRLLYLAAPVLGSVMALLAFSLIPLSGPNDLNGYALHWDIAHANVGLLYILAITSIGVYSIFLGGWAANSKYSLLGALRSAAQLISYEMAAAFALLSIVILAGSLDLEQIVQAQTHAWFIVMEPLAFLLYFTAAMAETNRAPFDLPEAESELVAGYHTEYSGLNFAFYFPLGEYINMLVVCSIATALFLGGWLPILPFHPFDWIPGPFWFLGKAFTLIFVMMWVRWTWPRLRYDKLMNLGWKVLMPLGLMNITLTGAVVAIQAAR